MTYARKLSQKSFSFCFIILSEENKTFDTVWYITLSFPYFYRFPFSFYAQSDWPLRYFFFFFKQDCANNLFSSLFRIILSLHHIYSIPADMCLFICVQMFVWHGILNNIQAKAPRLKISPFFFQNFYRRAVTQHACLLQRQNELFSSESLLLDDMMLITRGALQHRDRKRTQMKRWKGTVTAIMVTLRLIQNSLQIYLY